METFFLFFEKCTTSEQISLVEANYYCVCNRCQWVYMYKVPDSSSFGTKNSLDHVKSCSGSKSVSQLQISQYVRSKPQITKWDSAPLMQMVLYLTLHRNTKFMKSPHQFIGYGSGQVEKKWPMCNSVLYRNTVNIVSSTVYVMYILPCPEKRGHVIFNYNTRISWSIFLYFLYHWNRNKHSTIAYTLLT